MLDKISINHSIDKYFSNYLLLTTKHQFYTNNIESYDTSSDVPFFYLVALFNIMRHDFDR